MFPLTETVLPRNCDDFHPVVVNRPHCATVIIMDTYRALNWEDRQHANSPEHQHNIDTLKMRKYMKGMNFPEKNHNILQILLISLVPFLISHTITWHCNILPHSIKFFLFARYLANSNNECFQNNNVIFLKIHTRKVKHEKNQIV